MLTLIFSLGALAALYATLYHLTVLFLTALKTGDPQ